MLISRKLLFKLNYKTNDIACLNKSHSLKKKQSFIFRINVISLILILASYRVYWNRNIDFFVSLRNKFILEDLNKLEQGVFMVFIIDKFLIIRILNLIRFLVYLNYMKAKSIN